MEDLGNSQEITGKVNVHESLNSCESKGCSLFPAAENSFMDDEFKCLLCGEPIGDDGARGLCSSHYNAVMYRLRSKYGSGTDARKLAEQALIDEGLLLPHHKTGPKSDPKMKLVEIQLRKVDHELAKKRQQETTAAAEELNLKVAEDPDEYDGTKAKRKKKGR